jgi:Uma2 family endonuclease
MKSATKMSYVELQLLPDDRQRHELVDGELLMTPAPRPRHQRVLNKLNIAISAHVEKHQLGEVFIAPVDVVLDEHTVLEPDLLFVKAERSGIVQEDAIHGAPDLVVEILSPSSFYNDQRVKLAAYGKFGVGEYWIVDPEIETIAVYRFAGAKLELARQFNANESLESPLFTGIHLPIGSIFS